MPDTIRCRLWKCKHAPYHSFQSLNLVYRRFTC